MKTRRDFVKLVGLAGSSLLVPPWVTACQDAGDPTGPARETLDASPRRAPVEGYTDATSYRAGETVCFHLSNNLGSSSVGVDVMHVGAVDTRVTASGTVQVEPQAVPHDAAQSGCAWPVGFEFPIPSDWRSGVYFARFWSGPVTNPMWASTIPFVVKPATRGSPILYQLAVATYQAYNAWGGSSLYTHDGLGYTYPFASFDRPYSHLRQFRQWDLPFIRWMGRAGLNADYCTSIDVHRDPALRLDGSGYRLLVSVGHDEYWSWEMRDNVEAFIVSGGNVAFFGGNTCFWQIRLEADARRIVCYKDPHRNTWRDPAFGWGPEGRRRVTTTWSRDPVNRPEELLTGLSYRYGAGYYSPPKPADVPFHVGPKDHWVFAGASLPGGVCGQGTVGYETDAACLGVMSDGAPAVDSHNIPVICEDEYRPPDSIMVLAATDRLAWRGKPGRATMAMYRNNGVVFNAATTNWVAGLHTSEQVRNITRNVVQRLAGAVPPSPSLANLGFESWSSPALPDGWYRDPAAAQEVFQETASGGVRSGAASLRVNAQSGHAWLAQDFSAIGGEYYVVSGWIRSSAALVGNDGHWLTVSLEDKATGQALATARYTATDGAWQHVRAYARADAVSTYAARIKLDSYLAGDAWFDGLRVDLL